MPKKKNRQVNVYLPTELVQAAKIAAIKAETSLSALIVELLTNELNKKK